MLPSTTAPPAATASAFLAALREQVACYERLEMLSGEQAQHARAGDAGA